MTSLLQEAVALKARRNAKEEREKNRGKVLDFPQALLEKLKREIKNMPNAFELLYTYYGVNMDLNIDKVIEIVLSNRESDPRFYDINIGDPSATLIQENHMASRDEGATLEPMLQAWAIKFPDVYGLDIYFIPYNDPKKGFAITVIDTAVLDEDEATIFFPHDIYKKFAINQIAKHL